MTEKDPRICPHCGEKMNRWQPPAQAEDLGYKWKYICFNDDCPYYVRGWEHTRKTMNKPASYRHSYQPESGYKGPHPVWSAEAMREFIVPDED